MFLATVHVVIEPVGVMHLAQGFLSTAFDLSTFWLGVKHPNQTRLAPLAVFLNTNNTPVSD